LFYISAISLIMVTTSNIETEAFVVDEPNAPFKLTPIIIDEMRDDEFLIEMKYSGICHTVSALAV
jgi:Zn-dependent alcohol dehydrogenase